MIWHVVSLLFVINSALAIPKNIRLPEGHDFSPPEEVNDLPNSQKFQRSISDHVQGQNTEDTIKEVEELIRTNPALPRLTRGEILDILENITRQDQNNLIDTVSKDSYRDPKALMVVKAFTPLGSGEVNVEDLYTKPPVTSIIENENEDPPKTERTVSTTASVHHFRRKTTKASEDKKVTDVERKKPFRGNYQFKTTESTSNTTPRSRSTTTTEKLPSTTTRREIKRRRRPPVSTTTTVMPVTTYRPRGRLPPRKEIKYPNHKYPEEPNFARPSTYSSNGIRVVEAPKIVPTQLNYELEDLLPQEGEHQETFMPMPIDQTKDYSNDKENSISEPSIELEIPDHLKKVVADLNLAAIKNPESVSVTSVVSPSEKDESEKIKDILASIGVLPPSTTTSTEAPDANVVADSLSPDMQELLKSFGLLPDSSNNNNQQNYEGTSLGTSYVPEKAEIHPESYIGFKPLPEDNGGRKEMEDLLEQFGLLDRNGRKSKALKKVESVSDNDIHKDIQIDQISLDAVPEDLQPILKEMGFGQVRLGRKIREKPLQKTSEKGNDMNGKEKKSSTKQHVFNPADHEHVPEEALEKLGRLLEIMKKLEKLNGTISEEDLNHIDQEELRNLINSLNPTPSTEQTMVTLDEQDAPNPVEFDFGLSKNEVKRQEGTTTTATTTTTTESVEKVTAETVIKETNTPSIKDLEDSFGGAAETVTVALPEATTARRSGFYYLLDWNTFFDIDDQKGKRVNLRFQPKVGDPKRFYSVNVP